MVKNYEHKRNTPFNYTLTWSNQSGSTFVDLGSLPESLRKYSSSSVRTPGFRFKRKSSLPVNPYSMEKEEMDAPGASMMMIDQYDTFSAVHDFNINLFAFKSNPLSFAELSEVPVVPECTAKLLKKLNVQKSSSLVSIAEGHKTAAMVAQSATRIYKAVKSLRNFDFAGVSQALGTTKRRRHETEIKRRFKNFSSVSAPDHGLPIRRYDPIRKRVFYTSERKLNDFLSNTWLEYSYGWKPLLSDVYSHAEALAEYLVERSNVVRTEYASARQTVQKDFVYRDMGESWVQFKNIKITTSVKMGVSFRVPEGGLSAANVFGLTNPLLVAWELVPFSFVVDWFLPVGTALESLTATSGLIFVKGYQTSHTKREVRTTISQEKPYTAGGRTRTWTGSVGGNYMDFPFSRVPLYSFPSPVAPSFKDPRSFAHAASAIALLQSLFLRK